MFILPAPTQRGPQTGLSEKLAAPAPKEEPGRPGERCWALPRPLLYTLGNLATVSFPTKLLRLHLAHADSPASPPRLN